MEREKSPCWLVCLFWGFFWVGEPSAVTFHETLCENVMEDIEGSVIVWCCRVGQIKLP